MSLELVYRQHFRAVWRLLRRLGVPAAQLDDAAQDVFLIVHRKLASLDPHASVRSWVFGIAVRVASEYRRRAAYRRTDPFEDTVADDAPGPIRERELQEAVELLHALLGELDEPKRTVYVLAELEQLSVPEIADVLGENLNTVYSRLRAARIAFEQAVAQQRAGGAGSHG